MTGSALLHGRRLMRLGIACGVLLVGAILAGWHAGDAPAEEAARLAPAAWALPSPNLRDTEQDVAIINSRQPWGGRAAFRDPELPPPPPGNAVWRLAGIVERGGERLVLIMVGPEAGATLEYRSVGESLPDGSVLVQIDPDSATSQRGQSVTAERSVHRLFEKPR
jgi:hypothetical protein